MSYYQENRPAMGGLADALAMQGRRGDSTLVHMNPMEVRMLEAMSPDGRLSINPETGLPEAFKLKDIASFALPIAAGIAAPYLLPAIGVTGLSGVAAGAIGAGVGGFGSGLIQGKGVKDSLIQGGLSGLMSYGLGSAFAPATQTGPQALSGVPTAPELSTVMTPDAASIATFNQSSAAAGLGNTTFPATGTPTSSFANLGLGPKDAVPYTAATDVYKPGTSETGLGQIFDRAGRTSPFGSTAFDGSQLGPTQLPTYTQIGGSVLGSAGQMALDGMLSPEEMPYDIAGMDDMDAYYASRIPDLDKNRRIGRAAARSLNYPPSGSTSSQYYSMATSPSGFGTFYAADGGRVPKNLSINGQPHQLSYINQEEADLLRGLGGAGQKVMGIPAYFDAGEGTAGEGAADDGSGVGAAADGSDSAPGADMGLGGYSDAQADAFSSAMDAAISEADAEAAAIGEAAAYGDIGSQANGMGFGLSNPAAVNAMIGRGIMDVLSPVPTFAVRGIASMLGRGAEALGIPGTTETASEAVDSQEASQDGSGGDGGVSVYGRPYGDPYNTEKVQASPAPEPSPVGPTALRSLSPTAPRTAGDIFGAATTGGIPRFFTTMAQGGVVRRQDGGDLTADDFYREATVTGIERRLPIQQFVPSQSRGVQESLTSMFPNFTVAPANQIQQSGMTLADVGRLKELMKSGPAAFRLLGMIGMAQGGGISSLAYGGEAAPVGFANKAFEGMVPGQGTGMSDDVPFSIEGNQPALLSRDEYVLPADVVSQLGDGSSSAGADMLDNFISQVRQTKYGNTQQPAPVGPQLMTGLMRQGGVV